MHELRIKFILKNYIITDSHEIANPLNTYFLAIGHSLSKQVQAVRTSAEYLRDRTHTNFTFSKVSEQCIDSIISYMKPKSSS